MTTDAQREQARRDDAVAVLRAVWPDAPAELDEFLGKNFTFKVGNRNRALRSPTGDSLCGHRLELPLRNVQIMVGGGGVVIPCREADVPVDYALKVVRPTLYEEARERGEISEEYEKAEDERRTHLPLSHENIAKLYGTDTVIVKRSQVHDLKLGATLIEWVQGAQPFGRYLEEGAADAWQVADLIQQASRALVQLHESGKVHWDVKGDNVLVSAQGVVKLMDLGNARPLRPPGDKYETRYEAETTLLNLPPELERRALKIRGNLTAAGKRVSNNRAPCHFKAGEGAWDRPWLDLYMLAREVNRVFGFDEASAALDDPADGVDAVALCAARRDSIFGSEAGGFVCAYLRRLVGRLLAADSPDATPFYEDADAVVRALERLLPEYGEATDVPELEAVSQHVLRVPPFNNVPWTPRVNALMNSRPLLRLKRHRQLATVRDVFPGAEHTRWEHVSGALVELLQRIRALFADRSTVSIRLDTSKLDVTALILATLVHDLAHPAYGHQLEESPLIPPNEHHESYGRAVLRATIGDRRKTDAIGKDAEALVEVLDQYWVSSDMSRQQLVGRAIEILEAGAGTPGADEDPTAQSQRLHLETLRSLIDGQLDADKADYLVRDAHHCGVEYASGIDRRRLDQALTTLEVPIDGVLRGTIGVTQKGVLPLESMLIARYQMFRAVYWQHTVRAMTVMLQEAVEEHVVSSDDSKFVASRLRDLLHQFRELSDDAALDWLEAKLARRQKHVRELCEGVRGNRRNVFWHVAEFQPRTELLDELADAKPVDDKVYDALQQHWTRGARADGVAVLLSRRRLRSNVAAAITAEANESPQIKSQVKLDTHDVLLDIPLAGRDEVRDLYVLVERGTEKRTAPVQDLTPLAHAVTQAFQRSARPARIFLSPSVCRPLLEVGEWERFQDVASDAVRKELTDQLPLFDIADGAGRR
ncbi:MAG TPA: protein kinase [Thermoleophilaceae bacterium]|jgi:HD superfamily phosphohydrolase